MLVAKSHELHNAVVASNECGQRDLPLHCATKGLTKCKKVYILLIMNEQRHQASAAQLAEIEATCACSHVRKAARVVTQLFDEVLQPTGLRSTQFTLMVAVAMQV